MCIIQYVLGFVYSYWLDYIRKTNKLGKSVILYAWFFYPIIESGIEERVFNTIFIARTVYDMIFFVFIYNFILKKRPISAEEKLKTSLKIRIVFASSLGKSSLR